MTLSQFNVCLVQMALDAEPSVNVARACEQIHAAAKLQAQIVCLPELFHSRYFCQHEDTESFDLAESIPGPITRQFTELARDLGVVLLVPLFERQAAGLFYNSLVVIDRDGSLLGKYRKMHIPDDPAYYEKYYFTPGDLGFRAFNTSYGCVGGLICWDQWFPEAARLTAMHGASVLFYPTAIGWHPREKALLGAQQRDAWRTVQRGHAIANGVYVAAVNRVGLERPTEREDGIEFWGSSFIADPQGVVIAEASAEREELLMATIDLDRIEEIRRHWPFWRDRRVDVYKGIQCRHFADDNP